jgi:hypothetical protein
MTMTNLIMCNNSIQYSNHGNAYIYTSAITNDCEGDSDSDGLPDSWEMQYFDTLTYNGADDPDSDGINNQQEYQSGTNPTAATPLPEPNFSSAVYTFEPRNVYENYVASYEVPNDSGVSGAEYPISWADSARQGTAEPCADYYQAVTSSDCTYYDWTANPPVFSRYTNGVVEYTRSLWPIGLPFWRMEYADNITGYGPAWSDCTYPHPGLGSWSYAYSDEYWITPTEGDGINYVYQISPTVWPHANGAPYDDCCNLYYWPATTNVDTTTVGGARINADGSAYVAVQNGVPLNVTIRDSSLNWYQYWLDVSKYQVSYDPFLNSINPIEPDYNFFSRNKTGPNGWGYDAYKLEYIITNHSGTQLTGIPFTNSFGDIGILLEVKFQVPPLPNFNTGWKWQQDVYFETAFYDPLKDTNQVFHVGRKGWTPNAPSANGNDGPDPSIADATPDFGGYISTADAPSIVFSKGRYSTLHTGSIISLRLAARTWPTWNDAVMSNLAKWHMTLTVRITSAQNASTTTAKVLNYSIGTGATMTPMTLQEARQYYNQP